MSTSSGPGTGVGTWMVERTDLAVVAMAAYVLGMTVGADMADDGEREEIGCLSGVLEVLDWAVELRIRGLDTFYEPLYEEDSIVRHPSANVCKFN